MLNLNIKSKSSTELSQSSHPRHSKQEQRRKEAIPLIDYFGVFWIQRISIDSVKSVLYYLLLIPVSVYLETQVTYKAQTQPRVSIQDFLSPFLSSPH